MTYLQWIYWGCVLLAGVYGLSVMEYALTTRKWNWKYPIQVFTSLLVQEDISPRMRDRVFYETAPFLFTVAAVAACSLIPLGEHWALLNLACGALFLNAILAYIMVAMVMAGWASNSVTGMIGGWRFLGQIIAYSMPVVMTITATVMRAESMFLVDIVQSQSHLWNIIYQPVGFVLFYLASATMAFLPPFDLPNSKGDLAGGIWAEFTGSRLLIFRIGRIILIYTLSLAVTLFFLGGWQGPYLPDLIWNLIKTMIVAASFILLGNWSTQIRHDHLLEWSWKIGTPAALFNILWVGILLLL